MSNDWKDILASMSDTLPNAPELQTEGTSADKTEKTSATLFFERKGRGGKSVTIIGDISGIDDADIARLASDMRRALGSGGSARGGEILIQGDRRDDVRRFLSDRGFRVKG